MYFTNALYEPTPEPARDQTAASSGAKSYGATESRAAAGDATVTVPPGAQAADGGDPNAGLGCVTRATQPPRLRMHNSRLVLLSRPTLDELIASLDIQDAPFVPPRFEPWRLMERIIANCAAVCIWVGGTCGAHAVIGKCTSTDSRKRCCLVPLCFTQYGAHCMFASAHSATLTDDMHAGTKSTSTCFRSSALTTPAAGARFGSARVLGVALTLVIWRAAAPVTDGSRVLGAAACRALELCCSF